METLRQLQDQYNKLTTTVVDFVKRNKGTAWSAEDEANFEKLHKDQEDVHAKIILAQKQERAENLYLRQAADNGRLSETLRDAFGDEEEDGEETPEQKHQREMHGRLLRRAYGSYLRGGIGALSDKQRAAIQQRARIIMPNGEVRDVTAGQSAGTNTQGGYTVPTETEASVIGAMKAWGPMNDDGFCNVLETDAGNALVMPTEDDTANAAVVIAENTATTENDIVFSGVTLNGWILTSKYIKVSKQLTQDSAVDIEALINRKFAIRFGRGINSYLTTGTGSAQPTGVITAASSGLTSAAAAAIAFNDVVDLEHSVDPAYRGPRASYMMHDTTLKAIKKIKDSQNRPLWELNLQYGQPATILGYQYRINQAMDSFPASASPTVTKKPLAFGDFSYYTVRRVRGLMVLKLIERGAEAFQDWYVGYMRVDGNIIDGGGGAVKYLTVTSQ